MTLGDSVVDLATSELGTLSDEDFQDCVAKLGAMTGFSRAHWQALAELAVRVGAGFLWSMNNHTYKWGKSLNGGKGLGGGSCIILTSITPNTPF